MLKILLKQQIARYFATFTIDSKTGKRRKRSAMIPYMILYVYVFGMLTFNFVSIAGPVCPILVDLELSWYYFLMMGLYGLTFTMLLSALSSYNTLYQCKDNELLLSMPIKPQQVLLSRLIPSCIMSMVFVAIALIPTYVIYFINCRFNLLYVFCGLLMLIFISVIGFALSGVLGFLIAQVQARLKKKNIATILLALIFGLGYGVGYTLIQSKMSEFILSLQSHEQTLNNNPILVKLGSAFTGDLSGIAIALTGSLVLGFAVYYLLTSTFLKMVTFKKGFKKVLFKNSMIKAKGYNSALIRRELTHLSKNSLYLMNVCLGTFMQIVGAIVILCFSKSISGLLEAFVDFRFLFAPIIMGVSILFACMNDMTSIMISIEGKSLWLLKALPYKTEQVLQAKLNTHFLFTCIPTALLTLSLSIVVKLPVIQALLCLMTGIIYGIFSGCVGLLIDLKNPKLNCLSEQVAIKQNTNVLIAVGIDFSVLLILGGFYYLTMKLIGTTTYMVLALIVLAIVTLRLYSKVMTKGVESFNEL